MFCREFQFYLIVILCIFVFSFFLILYFITNLERVSSLDECGIVKSTRRFFKEVKVRLKKF